MQTGARGLTLIKRTERLALKAYLCPAGVWTIGYGHTARAGAPAVFPGMVITEDQANAIFEADVTAVQRTVDRLVKVALTQDQNDALVSFVFNVGSGSFRASTLLHKLNAGQYEAVPLELLKWTKAHDHGGKLVVMPGLVTRRHFEATLWTGTKFSEGAVPKKVAPPKPKSPPIGSHAVTAGAGIAAGATAAPSLSVSCANIGATLHHVVDLRLALPLGAALLAIVGKFVWDTYVDHPRHGLHQ